MTFSSILYLPEQEVLSRLRMMANRSMSFICGKGGVEIRVKAGDLPTTICLCTEMDMNDKNATYPDRNNAA
jgi:hypothetical protein